VKVVGDLPFVAGADSPEVWARADEFRLDVSAGVPPDAFSATGQDWGLPMYHWDAIAAGGYAWLRQRARRMAALFDGLRVDHVVGLYRTYGRPRDGGDPFFSPADEAAQTQQGEAVLGILRETGLELIAEDLGVVPDFVRASLTRLGVPGCKVLRWERDWDETGAPFLDPAAYPQRSVAMTGTHDTEPLAEWWDLCIPEDRVALLSLDLLASRGLTDLTMPWSDTLRDALIDLVLHAASDDVFLPIQDLFGWRDRVNTPGTVGDQNWTWCLPWSVEELFALADPRARAGSLRRLVAAAGRGEGAS
jgi:4-alpha-glucanotransferase